MTMPITRAGAVGHGEMVDPSFEASRGAPPRHGSPPDTVTTGLVMISVNGGVGGASDREDPRAQIAVGDDPPVLADLDEERGHALFGHQRRDLGDRRVRRRSDGGTSHLRAHAWRACPASRSAGSRRVQASARDRR